LRFFKLTPKVTKVCKKQYNAKRKTERVKINPGIRSNSAGFCVPCKARCAMWLLHQPQANALLALQSHCARRSAVSVSDLLRKSHPAALHRQHSHRFWQRPQNAIPLGLRGKHRAQRSAAFGGFGAQVCRGRRMLRDAGEQRQSQARIPLAL